MRGVKPCERSRNATRSDRHTVKRRSGEGKRTAWMGRGNTHLFAAVIDYNVGSCYKRIARQSNATVVECTRSTRERYDCSHAAYRGEPRLSACGPAERRGREARDRAEKKNAERSHELDARGVGLGKPRRTLLGRFTLMPGVPRSIVTVSRWPFQAAERSAVWS